MICDIVKSVYPLWIKFQNYKVHLLLLVANSFLNKANTWHLEYENEKKDAVGLIFRTSFYFHVSNIIETTLITQTSKSNYFILLNSFNFIFFAYVGIKKSAITKFWK